MITLKNTQKKIAIDREQIMQDAQKLLVLLKYPEYDLGIWITTNKSIRKYNNTYRHKDKATDILSFPFYPELKAGARIRPHCHEEAILGDLIISAEYLVQEAVKYKVTFAERMRVLLVHGMCHLLGYDHIEDADYRRMRGKEAWLLKNLK